MLPASSQSSVQAGEQHATLHSKEECLMLADYTTSSMPGSQPTFVSGATFRHAGGRVTCIEVIEQSRQSSEALPVCVVTGSAGGAICAVPVQLPLLSSAGLEDVVVRALLHPTG
jgi:hypothetical protein